MSPRTLRAPGFALFIFVASLPLLAAPAITAVENAASNNPAGLPNASIAQGAIFIVQGSGLGPASLSFASSAFQSRGLDGTSIAVTVDGTSTNALMYYTSASQAAALLPSNTPTGTGTVTVTYNGQVSATAAITVVSSNLGIFTIDSSGSGPGILTYSDYSLVSPVKAANCGGPNTTCGAANPSDTLILWATGLGPVNGDDASGAGLGQSMPNVPVAVWLGGVQAPITYQGRSGCCIGEDQIIFTVPKNVPTGCAVPLVVQIGSDVSNTALVPIANGSRNCPMVSPAYSAMSSQALEQSANNLPITIGNITLGHFSDGGGAFEDDGKLELLNVTAFGPGTQPFLVSWIDDQPTGTCLAYPNLNTSLSNPIAGANLSNAGSSFTVTGPSGGVNVPVGNGKLNAFNMTGSFLVPGMYTITGGGSGSSIGPIDASVAIPAAAAMTSPSNNGSAVRTNGMTVNWTGGTGILQIAVNSCNAGSSCTSGASAVCNVAASLETFTVPAYILEALPAGNAAGVVLSSFSDASFTATGLDAGTIYIYRVVSGFGYGWGSGSFTLQ